MLVPGATAGSVAAMNATLDIDQPVVGRTAGIAGVNGEYYPTYLMLG